MFPAEKALLAKLNIGRTNALIFIEFRCFRINFVERRNVKSKGIFVVQLRKL